MPKANKIGPKGLTKNKTSDQYEIDYRWRDATGKVYRYREKMPTGTPAAAAKRRAHEINSAALAGTFKGRDHKERHLYELFDEYKKWAASDRPKTYKDRCYHIGTIKETLSNLPLTSLSPIHLERVKQERRAAGNAPATINKVMATLKHAIVYGREHLGWIPRESAFAMREVKKLKEPPGRVRYFVGDEEQRLFAALPQHVMPVVHAAIGTGMRLSELRTLQRSQVDLQRREVWVGNKHETKTRTVRRIPIRGATLEFFKQHLATHNEATVFLAPDGKPFANHHPISRAFAAATRCAGIDDLHFHDLRHEFATRCRRAGVDLDALAKLMGHSTIQMTMRYAHIGDATLDAAIDRTNQNFAVVPKLSIVGS